jgi:hypothetical protein
MFIGFQGFRGVVPDFNCRIEVIINPYPTGDRQFQPSGTLLVILANCTADLSRVMCIAMSRTGRLGGGLPSRQSSRWRAWGERRYGRDDSLFLPWSKTGRGARVSRYVGYWLPRRGRLEGVIQWGSSRRFFGARRRSRLRPLPPCGGTIEENRFVIKRYRVISLFKLCFRLILGPQLLVKSRKTLSIRRRKGILMAEIPVKAKPLSVVRTVLSGNALALQPRVVQTSQLGGDRLVVCPT